MAYFGPASRRDPDEAREWALDRAHDPERRRLCLATRGDEFPGYQCTLPRDHDGDHIATAWPDSHIVATWPRGRVRVTRNINEGDDYPHALMVDDVLAGFVSAEGIEALQAIVGTVEAS